MKVTYQTCCGIDVHKKFLVAAIVKTIGGIEPSYHRRRFSTFSNSILEFKQCLLDNDCRDVCMESTGKYLFPALGQCAHATIKYNKSPHYKKKYESPVKHRDKKRAIIVVAQIILTAVFQMLSTDEAWNPSDLYKIDMLQALVEKQKAKAIKQAKKLLLREGIISELQLLSYPLSAKRIFFSGHLMIACLSAPFFDCPLVSLTLPLYLFSKKSLFISPNNSPP